MKIQHIFILIISFFIGLCFSSSAFAADDSLENYTIDPSHSSILFNISHLGISNIYGKFNNPSGTLQFDNKHPEKSFIEMAVKIDDIDTASQKRDTHLKSPDFFDSAKFPLISFKSSSFKKTGEKNYEITGDLTLHGVTKSIIIEAVKIGAGKDPWGGHRVGFETSFTIKRSDFGMDKMMAAAGDQVQLTVSIEGIKK